MQFTVQEHDHWFQRSWISIVDANHKEIGAKIRVYNNPLTKILARIFCSCWGGVKNVTIRGESRLVNTHDWEIWKTQQANSNDIISQIAHKALPAAVPVYAPPPFSQPLTTQAAPVAQMPLLGAKGLMDILQAAITRLSGPRRARLIDDVGGELNEISHKIKYSSQFQSMRQTGQAAFNKEFFNLPFWSKYSENPELFGKILLAILALEQYPDYKNKYDVLGPYLAPGDVSREVTLSGTMVYAVNGLEPYLRTQPMYPKMVAALMRAADIIQRPTELDEKALVADTGDTIPRPTAKMFKLLKMAELAPFEELGAKELDALLALEPSLKKRDAAQGTMKADVSIRSLHQNELAKLHPDARKELKKMTQFIVSKINAMKSIDRKKAALVELAECVEDCVAVTQGQIAKMAERLNGTAAFERQFDHFLNSFKERALDETIYELFPEMRNPQYAAKHQHNQRMQFPHVKSGFLATYCEEIGFTLKGASQDANRNVPLAKQHGAKFVETFKSKMSIPEMVKSFITEVNGNHNSSVRNEDFYNWAGSNELYVMYEKQMTYPSYSPEPNKAQKDLIQAYIDEPTAYEVFRKLGYIE